MRDPSGTRDSPVDHRHAAIPEVEVLRHQPEIGILISLSIGGAEKLSRSFDDSRVVGSFRS